MKTIKLLLATTLLAGLSTLAFAGPSPQFWAQQSKDQQKRKAQNSTPVKAPQGSQCLRRLQLLHRDEEIIRRAC